MLRCALNVVALFALAAMAASCTAVPRPQRAIAAAVAAPVAEETQPLSIAYANTIGLGGAAAKPSLQRRLGPDFQLFPDAAANGTAYYYVRGSLAAVDLATGLVRWRRAVDAQPQTFTATPHDVLFQDRHDGTLDALDAATGATHFTMPGSRSSGSIDGMLFVQDYESSIYFALDETTGERLWKSYGGGAQVNGPPLMRNGVLLQPFVDDGAILENVLYAFDPKTGHALWRSYAMNAPIGYRRNIAYVDATWFPEQTENYVPLTVEALDVATGKRIDSYTYAPDPQRNSATYRNSPMAAYVTGGYVYLRVNGMWYRYDADRYPSAAHPSRLPGIDVAAAFEDGALLATRGNRAYIGHGTPPGMVLNMLPNGELRSLVARREDGTSYAVIGTILYRFNSAGVPRAIGSVLCADRAAIYPWPGNVAVLCGAQEFRFVEGSNMPAQAQHVGTLTRA
jgi:hypothetical protein